ncbi:MAG TPA: isocitrate lyase/PEP mutase family protein [Chloroflexota bacterium]|nr:isocitrate lyase/PEP mutase family protein [Chloroflexota bacterium]
MISASEKRRRFRELIAGPEVFPAVGCCDVMSCRLVQHVGLPAIHASGSAAHRSRGMADAGLLDMTEMVNHLRYLCDGTDLPVIGDADTGFGNVVNVVRTVREYERAGAAAMHIEDQLTPKRPMHSGFEGAFISRQEMVDKIKAAADTRTDENFVIIARCDVTDAQEKIERANACLQAGADMAWIGGRSAEGIRAFVDGLPKGTPCVGVLPAGMSLAEFGAAGARCALIVGSMQVAQLAAQLQLLLALKETGNPRTYLDSAPGAKEMGPFFNEQGTAEVRDIETRYGG